MKFSKLLVLMTIAAGSSLGSGCGMNTAYYEGTVTSGGTQAVSMYMTLVEQPGGRARGTFASQALPIQAGTVDANFNGDSVSLVITSVSQGQTGCALSAQGVRSGETWTLNAFASGCSGQQAIQMQFHRVN